MHGFARAQYYLASAYKNGTGVKANDQKAAIWFRKAAEQGDPDARYELGLCYYRGFGVRKDMVLAYAWFNLAVAKGHKEALEMRDKIEQTLSPQEIIEGQNMSRDGQNPKRGFWKTLF